MATNKTNTAKKIITGVLGIPAALVMMSELTDIRFWWVQAVAVAVVFALLGWWGLLRRTRYDKDGYAIER